MTTWHIIYHMLLVDIFQSTIQKINDFQIGWMLHRSYFQDVLSWLYWFNDK